MKEIIEQIKRIKNLEYILFSVVLLLAFLVRLYKIDNPVADWHSWRQADTASVSKTYVKEGIDFLYPRYHDISTIQTGIFNPNGYRFVEFPLYNALHAFLVKTLGVFTLEVWGRLLSVFSSLVSVYLLFLLGNRFIGKWGGVLAASFFAFLPYSIYFSRVILPEPMAVTLALASIWAFVKFIDKDTLGYLYLSAILFSLALLVKPFTVFYAVPLLYLLFQKFKPGKILSHSALLGRLIIFAAIVLLPFVAWRLWMRNFPEGIPFWEWAFNGDRIRFRPAFWRWIFGERLGRLILGIWGLVPFCFGLLKTKKASWFNHAFILGMFFYVTTLATANVKHDYYQIIIIPAVSLILAQGSLYLWRSKEFKHALSRPLLVFSLTMMFGVGAYQVKEFYKINRPEIIQAGQAVDKLVEKDALVVAPYNGDTAFLYQTGRWGWPFKDRKIETLIERGADYYVSVDLDDSVTLDILERFEEIEKTPEFVIIDLHKPKK